MTLTLTVEMDPVAKARPRVVLRRGKVHTFTPEPTVTAEQVIKESWRSEYGERALSFWPKNAGVRMVVRVYRQLPKRRMFRLPITKPDWDNYAKLVSDCLNGLAYPDDGRVTDGRCIKRYAEKGTKPRIVILLEEDDGE